MLRIFVRNGHEQLKKTRWVVKIYGFYLYVDCFDINHDKILTF